MADLNYNSSEALVKPSQVRCVLGVTSDNIAKLVDSSQLVGMDLWQEYFGEGTQGGGSVQFIGNMSKLSDLGTSQDTKYRENHYPNCQSVIDYVQNVRSQLNSQISNVSKSSLSKENLTTETDLSTVDDSKNKIPSVYSVVEYVKTHGSEGPQGPQGAAGKNGSQGPQGAQGAPGNIVGNYDSVDDLPEEGTIGAVYLVNGKLYVYVGSGGDTKNGKYQSMNDITGPQGPQGYQGKQGAQGVQGKVGSQGVQGHQGHQGSQGPQGVTGAQRLDGNGVNTVTSLTNLPIDKRNIVASISENPLSVSIAPGLADGSELQIRVKNTGDSEISFALPNSGNYQISENTPEEATISVGGFIELNFWYIDGKYVCRLLD